MRYVALFVFLAFLTQTMPVLAASKLKIKEAVEVSHGVYGCEKLEDAQEIHNLYVTGAISMVGSDITLRAVNNYGKKHCHGDIATLIFQIEKIDGHYICLYRFSGTCLWLHRFGVTKVRLKFKPLF